jgi:hypothetical protein
LERGESQSIGGVSRHGGRGGQSRVACKYYEKGRWDPPGQLETHFYVLQILLIQDSQKE